MEDQNKTVLLEIEERLKKEMGKLRVNYLQLVISISVLDLMDALME
jgi:hypothetical protein